jgi:hypothetical protein
LSRGPGVGARGARAAHGPPFGALLLDLDGCLIDSNDAHARAWSAALRRFGRAVDFRRIRPHIGKGGAELLRDFIPRAPGTSWDAMGAADAGSSGALRPEGAADLRRREPSGDAARRDRGRSPARPTARWSISLSGGCGSRTSSTGYTTANDVAKTNLRRHLRRRDRVVSPGPGSVAVGDTPYDIAAAHQIGLPCIALRSGGSRPESLRSAEGCYRDLADLWRRGRELFV